jgi:hypothetical protein
MKYGGIGVLALVTLIGATSLAALNRKASVSAASPAPEAPAAAAPVQLAQAQPQTRATSQEKDQAPRPSGSSGEKNPVQLGINANLGGRRLFPDDNV